jgi:hypothetical protein
VCNIAQTPFKIETPLLLEKGAQAFVHNIFSPIQILIIPVLAVSQQELNDEPFL